jgi:hypothetical protein
MRKLALLLLTALTMVASPALLAQDRDYNHGEVGAFFDYLRIDPINLNQYGIGGRVGFNVHPGVQLEAEGAYDFRRSTTVDIPTTIPPTTFQANFRTTTGLFGLKVHTPGAVRLFGVAKGGFVNFSVSTPTAPATFSGTISNITDGDTHSAFYPGGGVEAFIGWFGVRAEVGDLIYWQNGAHNNLRVTFGPQIRF